MKKFVRRFIAIFTAMTIAAMMMITNASASYNVSTINGIETVSGNWRVERHRTTLTTYLGSFHMKDYMSKDRNSKFTKNKSILQVSCTNYSSTVSSTNGPAYAYYTAYIYKLGKEDTVYKQITKNMKFYLKRDDDTYYLSELVKPASAGVAISFDLYYSSSTIANISGTYKLV